MEPNDQLVTLAEAAEITRAPIDTLRYWRKVGRGPQAFKVGRRVVYRRSEVLRWIDEQQEAAR